MSDDAEAARLQEERSAAGRLAAADKRVVAALVSLPEGRFWVERLLEFCGNWDYDYHGPTELHISLGRKQVAGYLLYELEKHAPETFMRIMAERRVRIEVLAMKQGEEDKRLRKADRPLDMSDMPDETPFESLMDQQARDYAPKETPK